jgi:uncharacterized membrane protein
MEKDTARIEAFSDGIFAVAITLLAIEIGIDVKDVELHHSLETTSNDELIRHLTTLWPKIFAYFNSFASVLLMWMSHHQIFKLLRTTSSNLILSNGLLLLIIALVPFPTKTMGEFLCTEAQKAAIIFYTGYAVVIAGAFVLLIHTAKNSSLNLFLPRVSQETIETIRKGLWTGFLLNAAIFSISLFAPVAGLVLNFCMWVYWAITTKEIREDKTT